MSEAAETKSKKQEGRNNRRYKYVALRKNKRAAQQQEIMSDHLVENNASETIGRAEAAIGSRTTPDQVGSSNSTHNAGIPPSTAAATLPPLPFWYPKRCKSGQPIYHGNREALGFALDSMGRSVAFVGSGAFLGTALIRLAKQAAGCATEADANTGVVPDCEGRAYGIRPSSLLTTYTIVVGIVSAALLPLLGAIVDYTRHRRLVGRCTSVAFTLLLFPQIFLSSKTWFAVAILQMGVAFTGWAQTMVTYAYLPELTDSEERLNMYNRSFNAISYSSMVAYLLVTVGIANYAGFGDDNVAVAQLGTAISFAVCCVLLYAAWGPLLQKRPPSRDLPDGQSLWTAGFIQNCHSIVRIYRDLPALKFFYLYISFTEPGVNSLVTIMITYLTDTLDFSSTENATATLIMLLGGIPGALVAGKTVSLFNPISSVIMASSVLAINTIVAAVLLQHPGQQMETYVLAFIWGVAVGWKWTTDRFLASTLIPDGQDAELMGVFLFAGQVLTWIPPLVFTAMNEAGVNQSVGIGSLSIYFFLGLIAICKIGDYRKAVARTGRHVTIDENNSHPHLHDPETSDESISTDAVRGTSLHVGTIDTVP